MVSNKIVVTHWRVLKLITGIDFKVAEVRKFGNLLLIRHPETSLNVGNCLRGHIDIGLTAQGLVQITDILEQLKDNNAIAVYSSNLSRSADVAKQIAELYNLPLFLTKDLRPIDLGELTGRAIKEVAHILQKIDDAKNGGQFPGGESVKQFNARVNKVFNYLDRK